MRHIRDRYELTDDDVDDDGWGAGPPVPRSGPRGLPIWAALLMFAGVLAAALVFGLNTVTARERDDRFCISCHTAPEQAYHQRAQDALSGAFAGDLSAKHYQQIRGQGGQIRCTSCHLGDGGNRALLDKHIMTAGHTYVWLTGQNDAREQKSAITFTVRSGVTTTVEMGSLTPKYPALSNDGCIGCHQNALLLAGQGNHMHNTLPPAYTLWKNGARLIPPPSAPLTGTQSAQALITRGLTQYNTTVQCATCHQTHRAVEADFYLDPAHVARGCAQCHIDTGKGPTVVQPVRKEP
jgi:nitrate/TMAO reductase-like tetraheme cytochrome c subunit